MRALPNTPRSWLSLALVVVAWAVAAPLRAETPGGLSALERTQLAGSGRVAAAVVERLAEADRRVRVLVSYEAPPPLRPERARRPGAAALRAARRRAIRDTGDAILRRVEARDFALRHRYRAVNALAGEVGARGLRALLEDPRVLRVDVDEGGSGQLGQAVPLASLDDLELAGFTGQDVQVAVLDSGVNLSHVDTGDAVIAEQCFCSGGGGCCPPMNTSTGTSAVDDHGHGSNVTGIITSDGDAVPVGGAPDSEIVAVKVLDEDNLFCCSSDVVAALDWVIDNRPDVDVVNMSLGTSTTFTGDCDTATSYTMAFAAAIDTLRSRGVLTVVAAGNDGSGTRMRAPACVANAISVAAVWDADVGSQTRNGCTDSTTAADQVACFSNSNAQTDLFAPGTPTTSAYHTGTTSSSTFYGTSQATALVTACVAALRDAFPYATALSLEVALESSTTQVTDATNGLSFPRLDCQEAFDALDGVVVALPGWSPGALALGLLLAGRLLGRGRRA